MDIGTVIGVVMAFGLIAVSIGAALGSFIDMPSIGIVIGGTFATVLVAYPLGAVLQIHTIIMNAFFAKPYTPIDTVSLLVSFAEKARREGILALENSMDDIPDDFIRSGLRLAVDGVEPELIKDILHTELAFIEDRHRNGQAIFDYMGAAAPAFGMVGTLVGLVLMLQNLSDPNSIGPSMAVALLTTFYGAVLANALFIPVASKLKTRTAEEILLKEVAIEGVMSIQSGDNPRILEQKLLAFLAPGIRPEPQE